MPGMGTGGAVGIGTTGLLMIERYQNLYPPLHQYDMSREGRKRDAHEVGDEYLFVERSPRIRQLDVRETIHGSLDMYRQSIEVGVLPIRE